MPRKGRSLERKIKELEELGSLGLQIKSPDYIYDNVAEKPREVDVSIRGQLGSNNILIIMECRDQKSKGGVQWIEQIVTKTKDIGAHKVIAVSSSGFTKGAKKIAKIYNVDLRLFEEINPKNIINLLNICEIENVVYKYDIKKVSIGLNLDDSNFKKAIQNKPEILKETTETIQPELG